MQSRTSIGMKFLLAIGLLLTAFSFFLVYQTWQAGYAHLQQSLRNQTELASSFDQAVQQVVMQIESGQLQIQAEGEKGRASAIADAVFEQASKQCPHPIIRAKNHELDQYLQPGGLEAVKIKQVFEQNPLMKTLNTRIHFKGKDYIAKFTIDSDASGDQVANDTAALQMIAIPTAGFASQIDDQTIRRLPGLMFGLLGLLAAVYASFQLIAGRHLRRFAMHLKKTAEQTDEFQFESLDMQSNDEVGLIADRYNELGVTLEKMYRTLELEVRKRTFELQQTNEHLKHKINECRFAEEQANVLAHEAMAANRAKSEFLANMSHELRTPMNSIVGFSEVLSEMELADEPRAFVKMIAQSGSSLLELINDLLDFSRIESGELEIEKQEFSVGDMLAEIESIMRPTAIQKGIDFEILQCDLMGQTLKTDRIRLRQCLMNLISNAVKFTHKGHVYVNVSTEEFADGHIVCFDVEDTGIGIPADKLEMIFDSFTQADGAMNRKYGGTGLGLAITKRLSELIGGDLSVKSEEGKGSVFSVRVPAGTQQAGKDAVWNKYKQIDELNDESILIPVEKGSFMANGKILVAEDNPSNQKLMTILLQKMDLEVTVAEDGQKAIEKCESNTYDLILMDMQMPNVNGYEATRQLRSQDVQTPIIAVTANAMMGDEEKCLEAGCDGYISKPIDRMKLAEVINAHLSVQIG